MRTFTGKFTVTKKDNLYFNFFLMRRKMIATCLAVFLIIAAMLTLVRLGQGMAFGETLARSAGMAALGVVLLIAINYISAIVRINGLYSKRTLTDFTVTFTIDKAGVHAKSDRGDSDLPWERISLIRETRHAFYIFITEQHANVIPKEQIVSESDVAAIRELFQANMDKRRLKLR